MTTMTPVRPLVTGGVDTHRDEHVAAALDSVGGLLGTASFPTTTAGYLALLTWLRNFGDVVSIGVEGTCSYGAALARHLRTSGVRVFEVSRPGSTTRRLVPAAAAWTRRERHLPACDPGLANSLQADPHRSSS